MDLKDKKCLPTQSLIPSLTEEEKESFFQHLGEGWRMTHENSRLEKKYIFKNFKKALEFTNEIGRISEAMKHHPEIHLGWGHCDIEIWTHVNNNLVENDFILAKKITQAYLILFPPA
jgi:4a-hydroxytetrahydrobiopterin dehydratase